MSQVQRCFYGFGQICIRLMLTRKSTNMCSPVHGTSINAQNNANSANFGIHFAIIKIKKCIFAHDFEK